MELECERCVQICIRVTQSTQGLLIFAWFLFAEYCYWKYPIPALFSCTVQLVIHHLEQTWTFFHRFSGICLLTLMFVQWMLWDWSTPGTVQALCGQLFVFLFVYFLCIKGKNRNKIKYLSASSNNSQHYAILIISGICLLEINAAPVRN